MIETKPRINKMQPWTAVFGPVCSRQHGVAQQKIEQPTRGQSQCLLNARDNDSGWVQIQMFGNVIARDHEQ